MPVFDMGYRKYEGEFKSRAFRWWPITRTSFRTSVNRSFFIILVTGAFWPLVTMLGVYAAGLGVKLPPLFRLHFGFTDGTLFGLVTDQILFTVLILAATCGGHISEDLRTSALQIYFSRPITHLDYVLGKLGAAVLSACFVTVAPAILVFLSMLAFAPDLSFLSSDPLLLFKAIAYSLLVCVVLSSLLLAFSALGRQARNVGILFAGYYFFSIVLARILREVFQDPAWAVVNLKECLRSAGRTFFDTGLTSPAPAGLAWGVLGTIVLACLLVLSRRAESAEVVS